MNEKKNLQLIKSGNPFVDKTWGGFYEGGTYFVIGPPKSGKTILALQYALKANSKKDSCLYLTTFNLNDLIINSSVIDLDLQNYLDQGIITLTRLTIPKNIKQSDDFDSELRNYFEDLRKLIELYSPTRIVVDELSPLIKHNNLKLINELFLEFNNYLSERGITGLHLIREDPEIFEISSSLSKLSTAYIYLFKTEELVDKLNPGTMIITPNIGHPEGKFSSKYYIEVGSGLRIISK
ncbi:MAG: ATPase domain-containing protein [Ignavibacteriaceae bacterium]